MTAAILTRYHGLGPAALFVIGLCLALWLYWPGQLGPALLDDRSSVLVIEDLEESPSRVFDYVLGDDSGLLGRYVSMATFVAEKLYLGDSLQISKRVNIYLHLVNCALFALLLWSLLRARFPTGAAWLAVVFSLTWALAPLHVSTVLYVVQRMAMLATTFMLLALLAYCWWRARLDRGEQGNVPLLLVALAVIIGLFAKENAIVVIPVLFLLEALWFQWRDAKGVEIRWLKHFTLAGILLGATGLAAFLIMRWGSLAAAFRYRPFTLEERLLTQSRALWDYLAQLVWPDLMRLGIYHDDFAISTGLSSPPTTLYSILGWVFVALLCVLLLRWPFGRRLAIGPAWYLAGHSVESSVLSLELYFEHRNYFPVMGFYLSAGALLAAGFSRMPKVMPPTIVYLCAYAFWLALQTSSQVQVWSQRELLVFNHLNGHPTSPRANMDMAVLMANVGDYERARKYSRIAFQHSQVERQADFEIRDLALRCVAGEPATRGEINSLGQSNPARPISSVTTLLTFVRMRQDGQCPDFDWAAFADRMGELFLVEEHRSRAAPNVYSTLATLENTLGRWEYAYRYMNQFLEVLPNNTRGQLMQLHFTTALGKVEEAEALKQVLLEKQAQGDLTVGEQQNLALYLE